MADSPEESEHTAVRRRIHCLKYLKPEPNALEECIGSKQENIGLPFKLVEYREIVDWTGRIIRGDKRAHIDAELPPIIERLSLEVDAWETLTNRFENEFSQWVGSEHSVRRVYSDRASQRIPSTKSHKALLG